MAKKLALLIGNDQYNDSSLGNLLAPQADVAALAEVLKGKGYGFEVEILHNPELAEARQKVFDLFDDRDKGDTLLLYFSGHGVLGSGRTWQLFLALKETSYDRPGRDSLSASDIKREMDNSYATRQIILLDCCHSGAFSGADKGGEALTEESFSVSGTGKALLASSTRLQASQDGSKTGLKHSLFTHHLVSGLQGAAANDEGVVTLEKLYRHVHQQVTEDRGDMTPVKWIGDQEGEFELGRLKPKVVLPKKLLADIESDDDSRRLAAVYRLKEYLLGDDVEQAEAARVVLERAKLRKAELHDVYVLIESALGLPFAESESEAKPPEKKQNSKKSPWILILTVFLLLAGGGYFGSKFLDEQQMAQQAKEKDVAERVQQRKQEEERLARLKAENDRLQQGIERQKQAEKERLAERKRRAAEQKRLAERKKAAAAKRAQAQKSPGSVFQDRLKDGSPAPKMVVIPAGSFQMGSNKGYANEKPVHRVTIAKSFALGQTEVTFADYDKFAKATRRSFPGDEGWGRGNRPVIYVSWKDAKAYAKWLSEQTGKRYRLPSEAEWEYAARAGSTTPFNTGACLSTDEANYDGNYSLDGCKKSGVYRRKTVAVGEFKANDFGLFDVHGNVWEWTEDCWHKTYSQAPMNGEAWLDGAGAECDRRVVRGGSWLNEAELVRSAIRDGDSTDVTNLLIGFRLARALF